MKRSGSKRPLSPVLTVSMISAATLLAKCTGILRSSLLASGLGAGEAASAFTAASRLSLSLFDLVLGAAIPGCFIPAYNRLSAGEKRGFTRKFLCAVLTCCTALSLLGILFAPTLLSLTAPGLSAEAKAQAVLLARVLFPSLLFIGSTCTLTGVLQSEGMHLPPALVSLFANLTVIAYLLFPAPSPRVLAFVVLISWGIQVLTLLVPLFAADPIPEGTGSSPLSPALKTFLPVTVSSWLVPASVLLCSSRMTVLTEGGNTVFEFASSLLLTVSGLASFGISSYLFPLLSGEGTASPRAKKGAEWILLLSLPLSLLLFLLAGECVSILYLHGEFTAADAEKTVLLLKYTAPALPFFSLWEYLRRLCLARRAAYLPMLASLSGLLLSFLLAFTAKGIGGVGLAFALPQAAACAVTLIFLPKKTETADPDAAKRVRALLFSFLPLPVTAWGILTLIRPHAGAFVSCLLTAVPTAALYLLLLRLFRFPLPDGKA